MTLRVVYSPTLPAARTRLVCPLAYTQQNSSHVKLLNSNT
jgi:hypothetical protein